MADFNNEDIVVTRQEITGPIRGSKKVVLKYDASQGNLLISGIKPSDGILGRTAPRDSEDPDPEQGSPPWHRGEGYADGDVVLFPAGVEALNKNRDQATVVLDAQNGMVTLGGQSTSGVLHVYQEGRTPKTVRPGVASGYDPDYETREGSDVEVNGDAATIEVGRAENAGTINVRDAEGRRSIHLDGVDASVTVGKEDDKTASLGPDSLRLGSPNALNRSNVTLTPDTFTIGQVFQLFANHLWMRHGRDDISFHFDIEHGNLELGKDTGAWVELNDEDSNVTIALNGRSGRATIGGHGHGGMMTLKNKSGDDTVELDGEAGDIRLLNADCAEDFDVADDVAAGDLEPGTVVALDDDGRVRPSERDHDTRVAGVVSGAGGYKPGIVLDTRPTGGVRKPVALMGKVFCKVDASTPIRAGDLLTTSSVTGHAMRAADPHRAFGAVLGKALRGLDSGRGLIPILVALQ
jgi:hypothetical protein